MNKLGTPTFAEDFKKLMDAWDRLEAMVLRDYPDLSEEERYEMCCSIMSKKLGLAPGSAKPKACKWGGCNGTRFDNGPCNRCGSK